MDDSFRSILMTIFRDSVPIESMTKSQESLSKKDWNAFFRIVAVIGYIIQVSCITVFAFGWILIDVYDATTIIDSFKVLFGRLIFIGLILLVATWLVSRPIDELTGDEGPRTEYENGKVWEMYVLGGFWGAMAIVWRYGIYSLDFNFTSEGPGYFIGGIIALIVFDGIYFGGLLVAVGFISQAYIIRANS